MWLLKNLNTLILLAVIAILSVSMCQTDNKLKSIKEDIYGRDEILSKEINKLNQSVTEASVKVFDYSKQLDKTNQDISNLSSRLKGNGDKLKQLQSSVGFITRSVEQVGKTDTIIFPKIIERRDTIFSDFIIPGTSWHFEDQYINIKSILESDLNLEHSYKIKPSEFYVDILKKNGGLFRKTKFTSKISSSNPNIELSDTNIFLRRIPKPTWNLVLGVGASGTYYQDKVLIYPSLNLTVGRNLWTIKSN